MKNYANLEGKEFISQITGESYGIADVFGGDLPQGFSVYLCGDPLLSDGCGNIITENEKKEICFWDHETDKTVVIASNWDEFLSGCAEPKPIILRKDQVKSVWIDPEFAKQLGIDAPPDGWKIKKT